MAGPVCWLAAAGRSGSLVAGLAALFALAAGWEECARWLRDHQQHAAAAPAGSREAVPPELARELHDTALATLAAIAGGRLDHSSEQVRRRAAQDVARIRGMLAGTPAERRTSLHDSLREVTSSAELLGLTVHRVGSGACGDLPPPAVSALTAAAREALNNVAAHAGTAECWLTMIPAGAGVTVRVVDRGCGFELGSFSPGYGLRHSVLERMDRCGGTVRLSSAPAAGTCVDLIWPK